MAKRSGRQSAVSRAGPPPESSLGARRGCGRRVRRFLLGRGRWRYSARLRAGARVRAASRHLAGEPQDPRGVPVRRRQPGHAPVHPVLLRLRRRGTHEQRILLPQGFLGSAETRVRSHEPRLRDLHRHHAGRDAHARRGEAPSRDSSVCRSNLQPSRPADSDTTGSMTGAAALSAPLVARRP